MAQLVEHQAPVVQKVDNTIHRINHYPLDIAIGCAITFVLAIYPVDSAIHRLNNWGQAVKREVVSSTPAGQTLRVLKITE